MEEIQDWGRNMIAGESPLVSILIVNWNGKALLGDCLTSITSQTYRNYEILVVDNDSTDGSVEYIERNFPSVRIIQNSQNEGFARACNNGMLCSRGEYIAVLNSDMELDKHWLEELTKPLQNKNIAATTAKALFFDDREKINYAGGAVNFLGFAFPKHFKDSKDIDLEHETTEYMAGGLSCLRRKVLDKVGLFDEDFFMYFEDVDLSYRIRAAGYKLILAPKAIVYHKADFKKMKDKFYHIEKNRLRFLIKNYSLRTLLLITPAFFITEIGVLLYSLFGGWFHKKVYSYLDILMSLPKLIRKRRQSEKMRRSKDSQIMAGFTGAIRYEEIANPLLDNVLNPALDFYWRLIRRVL
jgi:GT2 family glycosyltransferase